LITKERVKARRTGSEGEGGCICGRRTSLFGRENDGGVEQVINGGDTTGEQLVAVVAAAILW